MNYEINSKLAKLANTMSGHPLAIFQVLNHGPNYFYAILNVMNFLKLTFGEFKKHVADQGVRRCYLSVFFHILLFLVCWSYFLITHCFLRFYIFFWWRHFLEVFYMARTQNNTYDWNPRSQGDLQLPTVPRCQNSEFS